MPAKDASPVLVTGGAGFIGSHLVRRLLADGRRVRVLDNLSTGRRDRVPAQAEFVEADCTDLEAIRPAFRDVKSVFHTAALPRVQVSIDDPVTTSIHNIMGTVNVLTAARDAGAVRLVYSASSSAYGDQAVFPLRPDCLPRPLNPYAVQKYACELFCENFSRLYGLETVSLRYFNVYGPDMAEDGAYVTVIGIFKQQALRGEPLTIHGDGEQSRDFTHVRDVVEANMLAMEHPAVGKGEVLNVGAGEDHSVNEIARMFNRPVVHQPPRLGDPRRTLADISLTKELLGWKPSVRFKDGVEELLRLWKLH
jgi:nucleoside-diphosphate-sugar epimerase